MTREYLEIGFKSKIILESVASSIGISQEVCWTDRDITKKTMYLNETGARLLLEMLQEYFAEVDKNKSNQK